jgi:hypothetical protein
MGKADQLAISLAESEDYVFASTSLTSLAPDFASEPGLIHLDLAKEGRQLLHRLVVDGLSRDPEPPLDDARMDWNLEAEPIGRDPRQKKWQAFLSNIKDWGGIPASAL